MGRKPQNAIWDYFEKIGKADDRKALCRICEEEYSYLSTTGNLKLHLKKQHADAYIECAHKEKIFENSNEVGNEGEVLYEYVVVNSPASSGKESATAATDFIKNETVKQSMNSRTSFSKKRRRVSQHTAGKAKEKRLIEKLTEEKINITNLQKELIEKEMEEKNLKVALLLKEMKFKDELYEIETEEIEHRREEMKNKKEINELIKQEMILKIEVLKATLRNANRNSVSQEE